MKENHLSIWFIIGLQLAIVGVIVICATVYEMILPPLHPVMFDELHPGLFEGILLVLLGAVYLWKFRPGPVTKKPPITP